MLCWQVFGYGLEVYGAHAKGSEDGAGSSVSSGRVLQPLSANPGARRMKANFFGAAKFAPVSLAFQKMR